MKKILVIKKSKQRHTDYIQHLMKTAQNLIEMQPNATLLVFAEPRFTGFMKTDIMHKSPCLLLRYSKDNQTGFFQSHFSTTAVV